MSIREPVKRVLAEISYRMYRAGIFRMKHAIRVMSIDETIDVLLASGKSLVRFGDGEIAMMRGVGLKLQQQDDALAERLKKILHYDEEELLVTIQDIFGDLSLYIPASRRFWKDHLLVYRRYYDAWLNPGRVYGSTSFSRCYATIEDKSRSAGWFQKIRGIWEGREIAVAEGTASRTGVGNDLLANAADVKRILGPASHAYAAYDRILAACLRMPKERLFLLAIGPCAKPLAEDLFHAGYRVIDIGNLNNEYNWFLTGVRDKNHVEPEALERIRSAEEKGMQRYLSEIAERIE